MAGGSKQGKKPAKAKGGRGRSRSRGKSREPARSAKPSPPQDLSSFIPQAGEAKEDPSAPLPRKERRGRSPAPSTTSESNVDAPSRSERASLIARLRDERQQFKAAMRRFFAGEGPPEERLIAWAKAANLRSKLANNYRVRAERGWDTPNAKTMRDDLRDAGGDPGEPEYISALLHWPSYAAFLNERTRQRNEVALVMQADDGRSLWEHPKALPSRIIDTAIVMTTYQDPPRLGKAGIVFQPPDESAWEALKAQFPRFQEMDSMSSSRGSFASSYSFISSDEDD